MKLVAALALASFAFAGSTAAADDVKVTRERAGNCNEAKSQMAYFCDAKPDTDMMSQFGACDNARKNVKLACEGVDEGDRAYKFDK